MSLSDFLADDSKIHKNKKKILIFIYSWHVSLLATGGSWADDVADLPSARKFRIPNLVILFELKKKIFFIQFN